MRATYLLFRKNRTWCLSLELDSEIQWMGDKSDIPALREKSDVVSFLVTIMLGGGVGVAQRPLLWGEGHHMVVGWWFVI
jgi:hypothetical protein